MNDSLRRRDTLKQWAAGAGALALGVVTPARAQQEAIKVACIYPLSGPLGLLGNAMLIGARIAVEQFNRAGGLLGRRIEVVARDDKASPAESALVARDVFSAGIKLIVGGLITAPAMAITNLLKENNALFVLTGSQVMSVTHENFNPNAFRTQVNARMTLYSVAQPMPELYPSITRWGGLTVDNQQGTDNYRLFSTAMKKAYQERLGKTVEILDPVLVPFPANDFKGAIARLLASPIEGLSTTGLVGADYYTFMGQARQLGLYNKIKVFIEAGQGTGIGKGLGANLPEQDLWTPTLWYPGARDANVVARALASDYAAMTKDSGPPDPAIYNGHTGMLAMLQAIRDAGSLDPAAVRVALERVEFETANGPFRFRREDHQGLPNMLLLKISPKSAPPGWEVARAITVRGDSVVEPAAPGEKFVAT